MKLAAPITIALLPSALCLLLACDATAHAPSDSAAGKQHEAAGGGRGAHMGSGASRDEGDRDIAVDSGAAVPPDRDAAVSPTPPPDAGDDEVAADSATASHPCLGDVVVATDDDVGAIAQCTAIEGSLTFTGDGITTVDLPLLESVGHALKVEATALRELELPALDLVGTALLVSNNTALERIALPALATVHEGISIGGNWQHQVTEPVLASIELPALTAVGDQGDASGRGQHSGPLEIVGVGALTTIQLAALEHVVGNIRITDDPELERIELPALDYVAEELWIDGDDALTTVSMPALDHSDGREFSIRAKALSSLELPSLRYASLITISSDAALASVELPALEGAETLRIGPTSATRLVFPKLSWIYRGLVIQDNPELTSFELPVFEKIGFEWAGPNDDPNYGFYIEDNERLEEVELPALSLLAADLLVKGNPLLSRFVVPVLEHIGNSVELRGSGLTTLSAPLLAKVGGTCGSCNLNPYGILIVADNASLQSFDLPLLTVVGNDFEVTGNTSLATCSAQALAAQLATTPTKVMIAGNAGACL